MPKLIGRVKNASFVGIGGDDRIPVVKYSVYFIIQPLAPIALMRFDKIQKSVKKEDICQHDESR